MRRVIGIDHHRTFGEVVIWENNVTRHEGRIDMTCTVLEGFGRQLKKTDEVVIEATGNCMAVFRDLSPYVKRVVIANPLHVKAIAHGKAKRQDADILRQASIAAQRAAAAAEIEQVALQHGYTVAQLSLALRSE